MFTRISPEVYEEIRDHGGLSRDEASAAIGKERQIVYRIEGKKKQLLTAEQGERLVRRANLSTEAFVVIMCKVLSKLLGRPVIIAPPGRYLPSSPLARAAEMFKKCESRLSLELRHRIISKLNNGQMLEAAADQIASDYETDIRELIEQALGPAALENED